MSAAKTYAGIHNDEYGGMTYLGSIVKDAWIFGLIPETESCEGWSYAELQALRTKTTKLWDDYGHLASGLPPEVRERHTRIHDKALARAKELGWDPIAIYDNDEDES